MPSLYPLFDIFVNCSWVATRWQLYSTHLHTNNTQNDTKRTIHRTTQKLEKSQKLEKTQKLEQYKNLEQHKNSRWNWLTFYLI